MRVGMRIGISVGISIKESTRRKPKNKDDSLESQTERKGREKPSQGRVSRHQKLARPTGMVETGIHLLRENSLSLC